MDKIPVHYATKIFLGTLTKHHLNEEEDPDHAEADHAEADHNLAPPACQVPGDGQGQGHVTESLHQQHTRTLGGQESGKYIS